MAQKVEDFNLPPSAISKIVKEAIPEGVQVTDEAKKALNKAASVFVLYATSSANSLAQDSNRKRLVAQDVLDALKELDLELLIPPLHVALKAYHKSMESKKQAKENKRISGAMEETTEPEVQMVAEKSETSFEEDVIVIDSSDSNSGNEESNDEESGSD